MADFSAVEARLRSILDPYRDRLESNPLYGVDTLKRPGGGAHDFFAGVRVGKRYVSYHLMPVYARPQLLDGQELDESLMRELETLTRRSFDVFSSEAYPRRLVSTPG